MSGLFSDTSLDGEGAAVSEAVGGGLAGAVSCPHVGATGAVTISISEISAAIRRKRDIDPPFLPGAKAVGLCPQTETRYEIIKVWSWQGCARLSPVLRTAMPLAADSVMALPAALVRASVLRQMIGWLMPAR
jgi:hypothetical protein